jgi:hypothetical protein
MEKIVFDLMCIVCSSSFDFAESRVSQFSSSISIFWSDPVESLSKFDSCSSFLRRQIFLVLLNLEFPDFLRQFQFSGQIRSSPSPCLIPALVFFADRFFFLPPGCIIFLYCFQSCLLGLHLTANCQGVSAPAHVADLASRCLFGADRFSCSRP